MALPIDATLDRLRQKIAEAGYTAPVTMGCRFAEILLSRVVDAEQRAARLERERDEARTLLEDARLTRNQRWQMAKEAKAERDQARAALRRCREDVDELHRRLAQPLDSFDGVALVELAGIASRLKQALGEDGTTREGGE